MLDRSLVLYFDRWSVEYWMRIERELCTLGCLDQEVFDAVCAVDAMRAHTLYLGSIEAQEFMRRSGSPRATLRVRVRVLFRSFAPQIYIIGVEEYIKGVRRAIMLPALICGECAVLPSRV